MHSALKQLARDRDFLREMTEEHERSWDRLLDRNPRRDKVTRNDPPEDFHFPYLVGRATPYQSCDGDGREHLCGGVLDANQVVWLKQPLQAGQPATRVIAFTPSVGMIRLDARGLSVARRHR